MSDVKITPRTWSLCSICFGLITITSAVQSLWLACSLDDPRFYDLSSKVCCGGVLYDKKYNNGTVLGCCNQTAFGLGQTVYDETMDMCCGPYLIPRLDEDHRERECCEGTDKEEFPGQIVGKNQFCCGGKVYQQTETLGCCDAMDYNINEAICCHDQDTDKVRLHNVAPVGSLECCSTELYNASDSNVHCIEDVIPNLVKPWYIQIYDGREYDREYDARKQFLCFSSNYEEEPTFVDIPEKYHDATFPPNYGCCNKAPIDLDVITCCPGDSARGIVEHPILKEDVCCGNSSVKNEPECCNGVPNIVSEKQKGVTYGCCGTSYTITDRCCGGKLLPLESACCGEKEYARNTPLACCGNHIYNTNQKVCCAASSSLKTPKLKEQPYHNACCLTTQSSYNNHTHTCSDKGIEKKEKKAPRLNLQKQCPYCTDEIPFALCIKKWNYVFKISDIVHQRRGTVLTGQTNTGDPIRVRTPFQCQCFEIGGTYSIYTNRKVRQNKKGEKRLRIKGNDVAIRSGKTVLKQIKKCFDVWRIVLKKNRRSVRRVKKNRN